jgi:molybdenum ABC transporter molybdate-binding protein
MRSISTTLVAIGSLVVMIALAVALGWRERQHHAAGQPLIIYAAPTSRLPLERIAADYEAETGQPVELRFGASEDVLTKVRFPSPTEPADLFIPADDSYIREARDLGLVAETIPIARTQAVLLLAKANPQGIAAWSDLLRDGLRVAVPNPAAAVGKLTRQHLQKTGKWAALEPHVVDTGTVTEAANAARLGSVQAAIVWDAVANGPAYREQMVLQLPELDGVQGRIEVAVLKQSRDPQLALRLARFITTPDRGLARFRELRFNVVEPSQ